MKKALFFIGFIFLVFCSLVLYLYRANESLKKHRNVDLKGVLAFAKQRSFIHGDSIKICVHNPTKQIGKLYKLDSVKIEMPLQISIDATIQQEQYDVKCGFNQWKENVKIPTSQLQSGLYSFELQNDKGEKTYALPIIIEDKSVNDIVLISNTYTWQCYNPFGGLSNYVDEATPYLLKKMYAWNILVELPKYLPWFRPNVDVSEELLSLQTPIERIDKNNLGSRRAIGEWALISYLYQKKIKFSIISDDNFIQRNDINQAKLFIFQTQAEYWSNEMLGKLKQLQNAQKNIAIFAGNTAFRTIQKEENNTLKVISQANDKAEITPLIGTFYNEANYNFYAPYKVVLPQHWVFEGTNLTLGDTFGTPFCSGFETDQTNIYSDGFTLLAQGKNEFSPAHMVIRENPNGSFTFNASSILFAKSIPQDSTLQQILQNLIKKSLQ